ncbi:MAG TPA: tetratricopeptide repeat protein [Noviherbaspirillum sp.]|uniref:tetratricopeptide repeat protein n=1 Tax=Noviherbaspirillum sp. TaxID=1926288 RepID=UPI002B45FAC8|nr:tetratricopeptide repeat protein [Noviherbaspirillum sp.]HJV88518.1 tetratricopeptide repeat protein [Noviherbaspirillum sp.]
MNYSKKNNTSKADLVFHKAFAAHNAGKLIEAERLYREAMKIMPSDIETLYLLGTVCSQQGKWDDAVKYLKRALVITPDHPEALNNLGQTLSEIGQLSESQACFEKALEVRPDYADAHSNIGGVLKQLGQLDSAETHLRRALQLNPGLANAHYYLGLVLSEKDRFAEAAECFLRGLQLKPDNEFAYCDLGIIYKIWGRHEDARTCLERALSLKADYASALNNLGAVLEEMGLLGDALARYEQAIRLNPEDVTPQWNLAFLFLRQGILNRGWEAHERRFEMGMATRRFPFFPEWDGSSLEDKTILIYAEQGLGDEILFASCFPDIIAKARHCVIECAPRLATLFARSFPAATVRGSARDHVGWLATVPNIDVQIAAGSLPRFIRPTVESFPKAPQYLNPDPQRVEYWRARLSALGPELKIGICWRSGLLKGERLKQYSKLTQWDPIFRVPGVRFINLQYDECSAELREAEEKFGVTITNFPDIDLRNAIDDSAALTAAMDLVITAGTAVAEIAGALGVVVYRLDFYGKAFESLGTDRMPWHPTMKLIGQTSLGDWDTALALAADALESKVKGNEDKAQYVPLTDGAEIAVSGPLDELATYVLKESQAWFDREYEFVLSIAQPGMRVVDVGAGVGAYAIPITRRIPGGFLWARTTTSAATNLLMKSRLRNRLENSMNVAIVAQNFSLDVEMDLHGLDDIAFVRVAAEVCKRDLFASSTRFFSVNSPLLMFGIKAGADFDFTVTEWLNMHGFGIYRLVPGLNLLVPCDSLEELDAYSLNLFACKPDRAAMLEQQGVLVRQCPAMGNLPGIEPRYWEAHIRDLPYAVDTVAGWSNAQAKDKHWEIYWIALNLYAMTKMADRSTAERLACLQSAADIMTDLLKESANLPRLLTFCRILTDLGRREAAVRLLNKVCELLNSGMDRRCDEPFLALTDAFAQINPCNRMNEWVVAMILAQREHLRAFSTFFTGQESLPVFEEIEALGFLDAQSERGMALIKARFSMT